MYPVVSGVAPVGEGRRDQPRESGVGEVIVLRKTMSAGGVTWAEVVRRKGLAKSSMLAANLQDLGGL